MKTRKLSAVILTIAMLFSIVVPASALTPGEICEDLGILTGTGNGVDAAYLAETATRQQGGLIVLRMMGKEADALAFTGTDTFTDAADSTAFWQPILAYLKANPAYGFGGYPDGSFNPTGAITGMEFTKALLTVMGYVQGTDYEWSEVEEFAESVGLTALAGKTALTNEDIALAIVQALGLTTTSGLTLISDLVAAEVVTEAAAVAAGYEVEEPAFAITNAAAVGASKVKVEFNQAAPADMVVTLKSGNLGFNVTATWAADRTSVTLASMFKYPAGTYVATAGEATFTFTVDAETAVDFVIGAASVFKTSGQDLKVNLLNQYGEAMNYPGTLTYSVFNQTSSARVVTPSVMSSTIHVDASNANADDLLFVFAYEPTTMKSVQGTVAVKAMPYLAGVTFGDIVIKDSKPVIYAGTTGHKLMVNAVDQYGQTFKLQTINDTVVQVVSTNPSVVTGIALDGTTGNLKFEADAAGTAVIYLTVPTKGIVIAKTVEVKAVPVLKTISIESPAQLIAGDDVELSVVAKDQYGNAIDFDDTDSITFSASNTTVLGGGNFTISENKITVNADSHGTVIVFYYLGGVYQGQFTFEALPVRVPTQITGLKTSVATAYQDGTSVALTSGSVMVVDQYGKAITLSGNWDVCLEWTGADNFTVATSAGYTATVTTKTGAPGVDNFNIFLTNNGTKVVTSVYGFSLENVAAASITQFEIAPISTMYGDPAASTSYDKAFSIVGKTAAGRTVKLVTSDGLPTIIDVFTFSSNRLDFVTSSSSIEVVGTGVYKGTVTVKAWKNGVVVAQTDIVVSDAAPAPVSVAFGVTTATVVEGATLDLSGLVTKDQYGVEIADPSGSWFSSNTAKATVLSGVVTGVDAGTAIISFVSTDGQFVLTRTVTVTEP